MKRKRGARSPTLLVAALVIAALAGAGWYLLRRPANFALPVPAANTPQATSGAPLGVASERVDPANEGRNVMVSGLLQLTTSARDMDLGIGTVNALVLLRKVDMRQWRETCTAKACEYALVWADKPIDWHAFRERRGHENSMPFPFSSQRFLAAGVRLGAFNVDVTLATATAEPTAYPVHIAQLPPNLAATFRENVGVLFTGIDGAPPAAGDLRISYRVVPAGERRLNGIQKGERLVAPPPH